MGLRFYKVPKIASTFFRRLPSYISICIDSPFDVQTASSLKSEGYCLVLL